MQFKARAISGAGKGKEIGYPTVNIELSDVPEECEQGVYAGRVTVEEISYPAAIHYGPRSFYEGNMSFEVHLIDTALPSLPSELEVNLIERLRDVQNFSTEEALKAQIASDLAESRAILGLHEEDSKSS